MHSERYNGTIIIVLFCYSELNQDDWYHEATALKYAYNNHVHWSTGSVPIELLLGRPLLPFFLHRAIQQRPEMERQDRHEFLKELDEALHKAYRRFKKSQKMYKGDFGAKFRQASLGFSASHCLIFDPKLQDKSYGIIPPLGILTGSSAVGPYLIIARDRRTFTIDRQGVIGGLIAIE